jgi:MFS family permease
LSTPSTAGKGELSESPLKIPEFRALLPMSLTVAIGFGLVIPVLPAFARSFGAAIALVGLVQLVFGFTRFSFGITGGLLVDRYGVRATTMTGILIVAASSYACGFAQSFPALVIARGVGGAGSALFISGLMNRLLQVVPPSAMGRATGIWRSSFLIGIGIGPAVGGILRDQLGLRAPFHIYATGLLVAATIGWFALGGEPLKAKAEKKSPLQALRAARGLFGDIRYVIALLATLVGWWTISGPAQQIGAIFADEELGFSGTQIGLGITLLSIGELIVLFLAGRAADRYGRRAVLLPALAVTALATAAMGQTTSAEWAFFPLMSFIGAGIAAGGVAAGGLLADALPRGGSGTAVGVNQMAGDIGYMISPVAIGSVAQVAGFGTGYLVAAIPAAVVFLAALRLPGRDRAAAETDVPVETVEPVG